MEITVTSQPFATPAVVIGFGVVILAAIIVTHVDRMRRLAKLPTRDDYNALAKRLDALIETVRAINSRLDAMNARFASVDARIEAANESVDARIEAVNESVDARIEAVNESVDARIEAVNASANARIDALPTQESVDAAFRASADRIIQALINYSNPEPAGPPVFTEPL